MQIAPLGSDSLSRRPVGTEYMLCQVCHILGKAEVSWSRSLIQGKSSHGHLHNLVNLNWGADMEAPNENEVLLLKLAEG